MNEFSGHRPSNFKEMWAKFVFRKLDRENDHWMMGQMDRPMGRLDKVRLEEMRWSYILDKQHRITNKAQCYTQTRVCRLSICTSGDLALHPCLLSDPPLVGLSDKWGEWRKGPWQQAVWCANPGPAGLFISLYWPEKVLSWHTSSFLSRSGAMPLTRRTNEEEGRQPRKNKWFSSAGRPGSQSGFARLLPPWGRSNNCGSISWPKWNQQPIKTAPQTHPGSYRTLLFCFAFTRFRI